MRKFLLSVAAGLLTIGGLAGNAAPAMARDPHEHDRYEHRRREQDRRHEEWDRDRWDHRRYDYQPYPGSYYLPDQTPYGFGIQGPRFSVYFGQ